jgi:hypothetical protein
LNEEELRIYTQRIGNLALLLAKTIYKDSPYEPTRMIAKNTTWTQDEIVFRQKTLVELALKAWPLYPVRESKLLASQVYGQWDECPESDSETANLSVF